MSGRMLIWIVGSIWKVMIQIIESLLEFNRIKLLHERLNKMIA